MIKEIWKDIIGYEGLYEISNKGNVKSWHAFKNGKLLTPKKDHYGYLSVILSKKNTHDKQYKIHRLVCMYFAENPQNKKCVNHKNSIRTDNRIENLEWCTHKENTQHGIRHGLINFKSRKFKTGKDHHDSIPVNMYNKNNELIWSFDSMSDAKGIANTSNICSCCKGRLKTAGGYIWRYKHKQNN